MRRSPYAVVVVAGLVAACGPGSADGKAGSGSGSADARPPLEAVAARAPVVPAAPAVRSAPTSGRAVADVASGRLAVRRQSWTLPLAPGYEITTRFGEPRARGGAGRHAGMDLAAPEGTPVDAACGGIVVAAGRAGGYGNLIKVQHAGGIHTRYAHLSRIDVAVGERVRAGQRVGRVGDTGRSFGPHLHFEVRTGELAVDPDIWLRERGLRL